MPAARCRVTRSARNSWPPCSRAALAGGNMELGYVCTPQEVFDFWFEECGRDQWFKATTELDRDIRKRFRDTHLALSRDVSEEWHATPHSRLAAVIVLDQFPRNI